jgi:hypothetical protein
MMKNKAHVQIDVTAGGQPEWRAAVNGASRVSRGFAK